MRLDEKLEEYAKTNVYPMHMPGHKRTSIGSFSPYAVDITEIADFDDLNNPHGVIMELSNDIARLYGCSRAIITVNGSTCGNLAAIYAATNQRGKLLISRNSHKSVYHAAQLRELELRYLYPTETEYGVPGPIMPIDVQTALEMDPDIEAVVITSPTYEGVVSDVKTIAQICHAFGLPLIVDCAHGAHFGLGATMFDNPISLGADAVICSWHKTLPALTQTAVILWNEDSRIPVESIEKYCSMFQTSSPSYVLMASMAKCLSFIEEHGFSACREYEKNLSEFYDAVSILEKIQVIKGENRDLTKIVISTKDTTVSGEELMEVLRDEYHIELEMACFDYAVALSTVMDTEDGLSRLAGALMNIDAMAEKTERLPRMELGKPVVRYSIAEAAGKSYGFISLAKAPGRVAGGMVSIYPPGIPVLVAGELIDEDLVEYISLASEIGLTVTGLKDGQIQVIDE